MSSFVESACGASYYTKQNSVKSDRGIGSTASTNRIVEHTPSGWTEAIDELLGIRNLKDDWDGEGSLAPELVLVDGAINFAQYLSRQRLTPPDRVHLGVNGTIYFEWYSNVGYHEIEIFAPERAESRFLRRGTEKPEVVQFGWTSQAELI